MVFTLKPDSVLKTLVIIFIILLVLNTTGIIIKISIVDTYSSLLLTNLIKLFDFDTEKNIPTLFSAGLLGVSSLYLWIIHKREKSRNRKWIYWFALSLVFSFLSLDEIIGIHEQLAIPMRRVFRAQGIFYFAWIIPYGIAVIIGLVLFYNFLKTFPKNILTLFSISCIIFLFGAIGMEMIGGKVAELNGMSNVPFYVLYTIEESLEMLGVIIFIYALLRCQEFDISVKIKQ